tara:strand:- start:323 stop:1336 length:1014 start_codon:yes stop_codon:yes gene_type:complete
MKTFSCFSGIEAASVAMPWLNMVGFSEVDPFCNELLKHHYPNTKNYGDITRQKEWELPDGIEFACGGPPCQSFSVAGLRKGLDDPRGNLSLEYLAFVERASPRWVLLENVPGILSSNGGRDFGAILGALAKLGYGYAYATLNAAMFGVPQRRRRVFIVGHSGGCWQRPAAVLFNSESLQGNPEKGRQTGQRDPASTEGGTGGNQQIANPLTARMAKGINTTLDEGQTPVVVKSFTASEKSNAYAWERDVYPTLHGQIPNDSSNLQQGVRMGNAVRRLTPRECERLQGFPDDYTMIPYRGKPADKCPDGPRYKALGNSWAVPVVRWIGQRIMEVDNGY